MGSWSRTQHSVTHSSCESEIVAAHETVCEGKLLMHMIEEALPTERGPRKIALLLNVDAQACERFMMRRGPGAMRHLDMKMVSLQDDVRDGDMKAQHISSDSQIADVLTKPLPAAAAERCLVELGFRYGSRTSIHGGDVLGPETHRGDVMEINVLEAKVEDYKPYDEDYNEDSSSTAYGFWLVFSCMVICSVIGILTTCRRS